MKTYQWKGQEPRKKEERVSFYVWIPKKNQQHERPASRAARVRADTGKIP